MARFSGSIGFAITQRVRPGVSSEVMVERGPYYGDIKRASLAMQLGNSVNTELRSMNLIEIMADDKFVSENVSAIRYVVWAGEAWSVVEATIERPRLHLRLGGVYRGTRPEASSAPGAP